MKLALVWENWIFLLFTEAELCIPSKVSWVISVDGSVYGLLIWDAIEAKFVYLVELSLFLLSKVLDAKLPPVMPAIDTLELFPIDIVRLVLLRRNLESKADNPLLFFDFIRSNLLKLSLIATAPSLGILTDFLYCR